MFTIAKKELKTYFTSSIGYIYIGILMLGCGIMFYTDIFRVGSIEFLNLFLISATFMMYLVPILTMKSISEEKKLKTFDLLITSPKSISQIVFGKFLGIVGIISISALTLLAFLGILMYFGKPDIISSLYGLFGFWLISITYGAIGLFCSSLTENQIISAILTLAIILGLQIIPRFLPGFTEYSLMNAFFESFGNGIIVFSDIFKLVSALILFLGLTIFVIKRKRKGE